MMKLDQLPKQGKIFFPNVLQIKKCEITNFSNICSLTELTDVSYHLCVSATAYSPLNIHRKAKPFPIPSKVITRNFPHPVR